MLAEDRPHVEAFNRYAGAKHRLELNVLPEPFLGPREAPLVVLMLNPGLSPATYKANTSRWRHALRANLGSAAKGHIHLGLSSEFAGDLPWWRRCFRAVIDRGHSPDTLARKVLAVELHGYHATEYQPIPVTLPSQRFAFWLIQQAMKRGAAIVVMRGRRHWEVAVPELHAYRHAILIRNPRSSAVSPGNLKPSDFKKVLRALE